MDVNRSQLGLTEGRMTVDVEEPSGVGRCPQARCPTPDPRVRSRGRHLLRCAGICPLDAHGCPPMGLGTWRVVTDRHMPAPPIVESRLPVSRSHLRRVPSIIMREEGACYGQ
jgi:hypothetical protein